MNSDGDLPFTKTQIEKTALDYPTPFHIYDEKGIRDNARNLPKAFSWAKGFCNFFAVKACPNPYLMEILKDEGMGADCSSLNELVLAYEVGFRGEEMMFSSNDTPAADMKKAFELGAVINLDDITHIAFLEENAGVPEIICFRYNPGPLRQTEQGNVMGNPQEAKYGMTRKQLFEGYKIMKGKGVKRFGLHTMIASNELRPEVFIETANMLFDLALEINQKLGITFEFINLGGGIGIPYRPEQKPIDLKLVSEGIKKSFEARKMPSKFPGTKIFMENGRAITGPFGYLITRAIHEKRIYKQYIGVDSCMSNLMRPGMYGAYHHITVLGKEDAPKTEKYDVVGSLCENNDKFAIDRVLPKTEVGDLLAIHNSGAHGHSMGFNYNAKLRSAELLLQEDGNVLLIRRAETPEDYFRTLDFKGSKYSGLSRGK